MIAKSESKAEQLPARLYKFSAIIFPLDGDRIFRYTPKAKDNKLRLYSY